MVVVPAIIPVTIPVDVPTVATVASALIHVPPAVASLRVVVYIPPSHTESVPVIGKGSGLIVTVVAMMQPVPKV
jgi:hypothetical protein